MKASMTDENNYLRSKSLWYKLFLEHPHSSDNPQGYWAHGKFSITNSFKGILYMKAGIIHGIFPFLFPFTTSSWIIRSFVKLVQSQRHADELKQLVSTEVIDLLEDQADENRFYDRLAGKPTRDKN